MYKWVTIQKLSELTGISREGLYAHKKKGHLRQEIHWIKRHGRLFIHLENFFSWLENTGE
ncbi:MAG: hypothetical protein KUG75_06215 [Pseudomonadales bacterium]|nr:hypothetical protein [Pseudomonadales bacterium]